jgi:hypothetical protein
MDKKKVEEIRKDFEESLKILFGILGEHKQKKEIRMVFNEKNEVTRIDTTLIE